jgi:hypothetical protein
MKFLLTFVYLVFLATMSLAQEQEASPTICEASKSCKKACEEKIRNGHNDNNPAYQKLLLKCAEDVARNLQLIK